RPRRDAARGAAGRALRRRGHAALAGGAAGGREALGRGTALALLSLGGSPAMRLSSVGAVLCVLALGLSACGSGASDESTTSTAPITVERPVPVQRIYDTMVAFDRALSSG